ncbi:MAG TPA: hypothetical protein VGE74_17280 [Gemmata sp.]
MGAPGLKRVQPTHRIIAAEAFPDHVFVLYRPRFKYAKNAQSGREVLEDASSAEYVEVAPDRPLVVAPVEQMGERYAELLVVPRATAAQHPSALGLAKAIMEGRVTDSERYTLPFRESVPEWSGNHITITHRVQRVKNSEKLEVVRTTWDQGYQCCVAALLGPVAVLLGGLYLVRRLRKSVRNAAPAPRAPPASDP